MHFVKSLKSCKKIKAALPIKLMLILISLRGQVWAIKTWLNPSGFIQMPAPFQEGEPSWMWVGGIHFSILFWKCSDSVVLFVFRFIHNKLVFGQTVRLRSDSCEDSYKAVKSIPNSHTNIENEFCTRSLKLPNQNTLYTGLIAQSEHLIYWSNCPIRTPYILV